MIVKFAAIKLGQGTAQAAEAQTAGQPVARLPPRIQFRPRDQQPIQSQAKIAAAVEPRLHIHKRSVGTFVSSHRAIPKGVEIVVPAGNRGRRPRSLIDRGLVERSRRRIGRRFDEVVFHGRAASERRGFARRLLPPRIDRLAPFDLPQDDFVGLADAAEVVGEMFGIELAQQRRVGPSQAGAIGSAANPEHHQRILRPSRQIVGQTFGIHRFCPVGGAGAGRESESVCGKRKSFKLLNGIVPGESPGTFGGAGPSGGD